MMHIQPQLDTYVGLEFEKLCIQYMQIINQRNKLPFLAVKIGRWWGNNKFKKCEEDVDILLLGENNAMFCECKWRNVLFDNHELNDLKDASNLFEYNEKHYTLFSKSGYTQGVKDNISINHNLKLIELKDLYNISE